MAIGKLKNRITVKRNSPTTDGKGGYTDSYSNLFSCWADVKPMSPSRKLQFDSITTEQMFDIFMRDRSDYTLNVKTDKITYNGNDYIIHGILNVENESRMLHIIASR